MISITDKGALHQRGGSVEAVILGTVLMEALCAESDIQDTALKPPPRHLRPRIRPCMMRYAATYGAPTSASGTRDYAWPLIPLYREA